MFPGIILTAFNSPKDLIRFIIILFIIFGFPFTKFKLDKKLIMYFSCLILVFVIATQALIGSGMDLAVSFRDKWYFNEFFSEFYEENIIDF
jgi:phage shock protein PspC (stress-responsive transcriptional regulator)